MTSHIFILDIQILDNYLSITHSDILSRGFLCATELHIRISYLEVFNNVSDSIILSLMLIVRDKMSESVTNIGDMATNILVR